jgi:PAS domain-containing protein
MNETQIIFSTSLFLIAVISVIVALVAIPRRTAPGGLPFIIYMLCVAWWSGSYAIHWTGLLRFSRFFWLDLTYIGVVFLVPAFFVFVLQLTNHKKWLNNNFYLVLTIEPIITLLLLWTDPGNGIFFAGKRNLSSGAILEGGPWFWVNLLYLNGLMLIAIILLSNRYIRVRYLYRKQVGLVILSAVIPWIVSLISLTREHSQQIIDLTPFGFAATGLIMGFGLFRYRFLDIVPVGRDVLFERMSDGILVIDPLERIVDVNPAVGRLLNLDAASLVGREISRVLSDWPHIRAGEALVSHEVFSDLTTPSYLEVRKFPLGGTVRTPNGELVILRDITKRKTLELEREELITNLREALAQVKTLQGLLPICANCKKIRDDKGYWQQIEVYIHTHTDVDFSHGICPECLNTLYPEIQQKEED